MDAGPGRALSRGVALAAPLAHIRPCPMTASSTLRSPEALARAGLVAPERLPALERVAAQYAVAITPAMAAPDRPGRSRRPDRPPVRADAGRARRPGRRIRRSGRRRGPQPRRGDRAPLSGPGAAEGHPHLRGLLPVLLPPRDGGAGRGEAAVGRGPGRRLRLYRRPAGGLGGDRHRRRPAVAVGAAPARPDVAAGRRAAREGGPLPHPHAGGGPRRDHRRAGRGPEEPRRPGGLCRPARRPPARVDRRGPRRLRAPGGRRHPHARPVRAAEKASTTTPKRSAP